MKKLKVPDWLLKVRQWWLIVLIVLPFWAAVEQSIGQYGYVNGRWVELPFSWEKAGEGFLTGLFIAILLYGLTALVTAIWRRFKSN